MEQKKLKQYQILQLKEKNNWWYWGKKKILEKILKKNLVKNSSDLILDIGCEIGTYLPTLSKYGKVIGVDLSYEALYFAKTSGLKNTFIQSLGEVLPFKNETFKCIVALDIVEHIYDDTKALQEFYRILKPDGLLIIFVPAKMSLWSKHDVALEHKRRYEKNEFYEKVNKKFFINKLFFNNFFIFPFVYIIRQLQKKYQNLQKNESDLGETILPINLILKLCYFIEAEIYDFIRFPFGVSLVCIAKKK